MVDEKSFMSALAHGKIGHLVCFVVFLVMGGLPLAAHALLPFGATPEEKRALPSYCQKGGLKIPNYYANHLCYGANFLNRSNNLSYSEKDREYYLGSARSQFEAVIRQTEERNNDGRYNRYLSFVYNLLAGVHERQGNDQEAIKAYQASVRYFPRQAEGYLRLSNIFQRMGMKEQALEILKRGLKFKPNSKSLRRKLKQYGSE